MFANRFAAITAAFIVAITATANADGEDTPVQAAPVEIFPLPANTTFERHVVSDGETVAATGERLVYSNTLGAYTAALGAGRLVADDITTTVPGGCHLRRLEFPVVGKVNPVGTGGQYTVDFAIYSSCPQSVPIASRPGLIIPGTQGQRTFTDQCQDNLDNDLDGLVNDGCPAVGPPETGDQCFNAIDDDGDGKINDGCPAVDDPETDVDGVPRLISFVPTIDAPLPTNFWFGVKFSRNNAGVIIGAPATTGFSCDNWDFQGYPCNSDAGGFPEQPHASFNLEVYGDADCPEAFAGYKNDKPSGRVYNPGANVFLADDIQLGVDGCQMIAYEVAIRGHGFYNFRMQNTCESGLIAGTDRTFPPPEFPFPWPTDLQIARFTFDPPIPLPQNLWFEAKVNNTTGSVVIAGKQACIGSTGMLVYRDVNNECTEVLPDDLGFGIHGAVDLAITCAGSPPVGACCDMVFTDTNGDAVCREVPQMNCPWPWPQYTSPDQPQWVEAASCDADPFPFPCGAAACCRPDQVCENLTQNECNAVPPLDGPRQWRRGRYCGVDGQKCPWMACLQRTGDCHTAHEEPGCNYSDCCVAVCDADSYCCLVEWDRFCVERSDTLCPDVRGHDECSSLYPSNSALPVEADSLAVFSKVGATENLLDPRFCCRNDAPDAPGLGTVWFKFVATDTSARVSTCDSDPANDSLLQVFAAADPTTEETACSSLIPIACSDDVEECGGGTHGKTCVQGLTPGDSYYVMVAAKTPETKGLYGLEIRSPCFEEPIWNPNDCNENKLPDGCELGRGTATDCNVNHVPDECDIFLGTSFDCDGNGFPDECTGAIQTLRPFVPEESVAFGYSMDMIGDRLVIGFNGVNAPYLYLYRRDLVGWRLEHTAYVPDYPPSYMDMDGDWIVTTNDQHSTASLFRGDGSFAGTLQGPDVPDCQRFGSPVAISGDLIALGKGFCQYEAAALPEEVFIFRRHDETWSEEARIQAPDTTEATFFGAAVHLEGDRLLVGAPKAHPGGGGAAYVFRHVDGKWMHEATLTAWDGQEYGFFGRSAILHDGFAFVGDTRASAVYVFQRNGSLWSQHTKLTASGFPNLFGWSLRASGNTLLVVEAFEYDLSTTPGAVHVFGRQGDHWIALERLAGWVVDPQAGSFGQGVAIDGSLFAVGAPGTDWQDLPGIGEAYVFQTPQSDCNNNSTPDQCDAAVRDCNHNGAPDDCESLPPFDYDFDGGVDLFDLAGFQRCFTGPEPAMPAACCTVFDSEPDGDVDLTDFAGFQDVFGESGP